MNCTLTSETNINITVGSNSPPVNYLMTAANTPILYQIILGWWRLHTGFQSIPANRTLPWAQWGRKHPHVPLSPPASCITAKQTCQAHRLIPTSAWKLRKRGKQTRRVSRKWMTGATFPMGKEETNYVVQNILSDSTRAYEELRKLAAQKTGARGPKID